jgi:hypothetical protein
MTAATSTVRAFSQPMRVSAGCWQAMCPTCGTYSETVDDRSQATKLAADHNEDHHSIAGRIVRVRP